ncbi:hypothetical protein BDM02DRAFT_3130507 [Thelephora ganbajun]|uniref:Uncharacterized protein n=1 Tax=Thelephora ganbajun TaxID=370292 RepID=A0ACB6Z9G3_THEGA|nr:hypothetical protein BDM02DRAFT_3130507 [Thelephora ganbajun]
MNVVFSSHDPLNTTVIDLETDETLFTVYTEPKFMGGQTTVRKPSKIQRASSSSSSNTSEEASGGCVAQIDWHKTRPSVVRIGRRVMPLNMFLHSGHIGGVFGLSRTFIGPNEGQYVWKSKNNRLELYDKGEDRVVAESGSQELSLAVHEPALAFLEHVVLTFLVIRKQRRTSFKMSQSFTSDSSKSPSLYYIESRNVSSMLFFRLREPKGSGSAGYDGKLEYNIQYLVSLPSSSSSCSALSSPLRPRRCWGTHLTLTPLSWQTRVNHVPSNSSAGPYSFKRHLPDPPALITDHLFPPQRGLRADVFMHRFRKKSETRRSEASRPIDSDHPEPLPVLPPAGDFRTSLILPDLTRRFTLLRSEDGEPVGLEHLKARFAEQRARGTLNQVSQEEESMILEALGRMHVRTAAAEQQDDLLSDSGISPRQSSTNSFDTSTSSLMGNVIGNVSPSPKNTKRGQKRYSNNLFGSGKFRDDIYIRTIRGSGRSALSNTGSDASAISRTLRTKSNFLRPGSPEEADSSGVSAPSSPNVFTDRESLSTSQSAFLDSSFTTSTEIRLSHTFHPDAFKRASLALEEVIREIEEEAEESGADDDIVLLRSPAADQRQKAVNDGDHSEREDGEEVFTVTALSHDDHVMDQPSTQSPALMHEASKRMSPTPRIPGYIPGMQRPMTPHDTPEPEEQLSVTPRARSPRLPLNGSYNSTMNATDSSLARRDSNASTAKQPSRTGTPLSTSPGGFLSRSLNGRYTPTEERQGSDPFDSDRNSSKRRPASPLSTTSFQWMTVLPNESPSTSSRPNTPSSAAMLLSQRLQQQSVNSTSPFRPTHVRHGSGHSRNGSISSLSEMLHNPNFNSNPTTTTTTLTKPDVNKTITRNTRSPALPDSPYIESGRSSAQGYSPGDKERAGDHERAPSVISGMDLGSPFSFSRMLRSPTPNGNIPPTTTTTGTGSHQESVGKRAKSPSFSIDQPNITSTSTATTKMGKHQKHESGSSFVLSLGPSTQPLVLTPFLNSSRSSFGSEGSSYHSMDEENGKKDRVKVLFAKIEGELPEWHDFTGVSIDTLRVPGGLEGVSFRSLVKEEELVKQLSGLSRDDFVAVQERLLDAAQSRVDRGDRDKAGSVMKKRRPSTSQSFYTNGATTNGRVGSPSPAHTRSASPSAANVLSSVSASASTTTTTTITTVMETKVQPGQIQTQNAKANALLNSVIDAIESPRIGPSLLTPQSSMQSQDQDTPESPLISEYLDSPTRRNRDLADALFGPKDSADGPATTVVHIPSTSPLNISRSVSNEGTLTSNASTPHLPRTPEMPGARLFMGQLSSPNLTIPDDDELAKQVLAKVEAATMALRKSPSNPKFPDGLGPPIPPAAKRKVDRDRISSPKLLSASMSVDTIALRPTTPINPPNSGSGSNSSGTLKLGQRLRKLRGTLKVKPLVTGEDIFSSPGDVTPSKSLSPATSPNLLHRPLVHPGDVSISSTEHSGSFSVVSATMATMDSQVSPVPTPSSSGPGFKGFMARFRKNKDKGGDSNFTTKNANGLMLSPGSPGTNTSSLHIPPNYSPLQSQSAPPTRLSFSGRRSNSTKVKKRSDDLNHTLATMSANKATASEQEMDEEDEDRMALRQLWDAASQLKLDPAALNNLVARSPSNVSKSSTWSKSMTRTSLVPSRKSKPIDTLQEEGPPSSRPSFSEGRSSLEGLQRVSSKVAGPVIRKLSIKKRSNSIRRKDETPTQQTGSTGLRPRKPKQDAPQPQTRGYQPPPQPEEKPNSRNTIVRRTIIVPSETKGLPSEIQNLLRKGSTKRRRSASAASTHSIQDRVPTPPPPKNGPGVSGKRFSTDVSVNPMPSTSSSHNNLEVPGAHDKVNSAYDSLYEMYAEDSRAPSVSHQRDDVDGAYPLESGPAIEVIELANGETIWSIVNGLRGDDSESFYGDRASFASEYSLRDGPNDGVQLHFKEHGRSGSKGSTSSFMSSKKQGVVNRPETKVFFSSPAQIGRLIETLSKGTDSGSFNVLPHRPHSHATSQSVGSSSEVQWTVEERLEQLLDSELVHSLLRISSSSLSLTPSYYLSRDRKEEIAEGMEPRRQKEEETKGDEGFEEKVFVIEEIGHECVGWSYWGVLNVTSRDSIRTRADDGKRDGERERGSDEMRKKRTCIIRKGIVNASSPFKLSTVGSQEDSRAV